MWIFIFIVIIVILAVCVSNYNKKKEREARERRERLYREETSHRQLQATQRREAVQPQQNNIVASRYSKTQISSTQQKKKYNIPPAE